MGELPLSNNLSTTAKQAKILPKLQSASLISIGKLCDDNCRVAFDKNVLEVHKDNHLILRGTRNYSDGLWDIPITKSKIQSGHYPLPQIHPSLYQRRDNNPPTSTASYFSTKRRHKPALHTIFEGMDSLITDNEFEQSITEHTKL